MGDCLNSIFAQQGESDFEIILIDDASTDNTADVIHSYADPRIRVIRHEKNRGHVVTINEGLFAARGKFITRIDPDDRYRPYFLKSTLEKFEAYPKVGFVYGDAAMINEEGQLTADSCDSIHGGKDFKGNEFLALLKKNFVCAPTGIARLELWKKALPIPEGVSFSDWYLNLQMARRCEFYYVNRVVADYRVHPSNHHSKIVRDKSEEKTILKLLNQIFREREITKTLEKGKQKIRKSVYGAQYLKLADQYFGFRMDRDARRCYLKALQFKPGHSLNPAMIRHLVATFMGRDLYERSKTFVRSLLEVRQ